MKPDRIDRFGALLLGITMVVSLILLAIDAFVSPLFWVPQ